MFGSMAPTAKTNQGCKAHRHRLYFEWILHEIPNKIPIPVSKNSRREIPARAVRQIPSVSVQEVVWLLNAP